MILGITGKYCSGKNTVSRIFVSYGWYEIDVDRLGHRALEEKAADIIAALGEDIAGEDGKVDRKKLGKKVFGSKESLSLLESIIHPEMVVFCKKEIERCGSDRVIINAAILHKMGLDELCDAVLWVESPFLRRLGRALVRDSLSIIQILKRMAAQRKLEAKYYSKDVDRYTIWNGSSVHNLESDVIKLMTTLEERK